MKKLLLLLVALLALAGCHKVVPGTIDCDCPEMGKIKKECDDIRTRHSRTCVTPGNGWFKAGENCSCEKIPYPEAEEDR